MEKDNLITLNKDAVDINYTLLGHVKKDILFFFHELTEIDYIECDLVYSEYYKLPYWKYLPFKEQILKHYDNTKVCDIYYDIQIVHIGCIILLLAMAIEKLSDAGCYLKGKEYQECIDSISQITTDSSSEKKLIEKTIYALEQAKRYAIRNDPSGITDIKQQCIEDLRWAIKEFVLPFFKRKVQDCEFHIGKT